MSSYVSHVTAISLPLAEQKGQEQPERDETGVIFIFIYPGTVRSVACDETRV